MKRNFIAVISLIILFSACSSHKNTVKQNTPKPDYELNALLIDAATAFNTNNLAKAENIYTQILNKDKDNATALYYLSNIEFQKQNIATSIDYGKRAVKVDANNIWYKLQLSEIYLAMQKYDEAAEVFETIVKQEPSVIEYWQQLVSIYHVKQDAKKELSALNRMEERFGVTEAVSLQKFNIYREQKNYAKAEAEIRNLTMAFPSQSKYWSILAEMQMKEKNYDKAFAYYKKVEEIDPDNELLNLTFANYYLVKQNEDSLYYYLKKSASQEDLDFKTKMNIIFSVYQDKVDSDTIAFKRFFSLLETMKTTKDSSSCQLWSMLNLGYMRQIQFKDVVFSAEKAVELGCESFDLYTNWLYAASTFEEPEKIIEIADKAIETYPEQPLPYLFKGVNQELNEDYTDAIETLSVGLSKSGKDLAVKEDFYMNLGDCYHALGNKNECYKNYDEVLNINPDNYSVLNNYAYYLSLEKKDLDKALQYIEKVMKKYPDNLTFADTYAWVLFQRGEYLKAKEVMDKYLSVRQNWGDTMEEHYNEILNKAIN